MLRIVLSVFGVLAIANNVLAQQYSNAAARSKAIEANSPKGALSPVKPSIPAKPTKQLPNVSLPNVRPAQQNPTQKQQAQQQPTIKNGTVLATISVNPQNKVEKSPFGKTAGTSSSTERISTESRQETDGRISTKTTKTVTTIRPDGARQVATSYNTRVSISSSPAKTTPVFWAQLPP